MNKQKQRIAIAEACGWKSGKCPCREELCDAWKTPAGDNWEYVPDYLNDLNAMHEAEEVLTQQQRIEYVRDLGYIWTGRNDRAIPNWWFVHDATATQRAAAFLRTIGKWEEDE
jgi:hypothetical protein